MLVCAWAYFAPTSGHGVKCDEGVIMWGFPGKGSLMTSYLGSPLGKWENELCYYLEEDSCSHNSSEARVQLVCSRNSKKPEDWSRSEVGVGAEEVREAASQGRGRKARLPETREYLFPSQSFTLGGGHLGLDFQLGKPHLNLFFPLNRTVSQYRKWG